MKISRRPSFGFVRSLIVAGLFGLLSTQAFAQVVEGVKIGFVNVDKLMRESKIAKKYEARSNDRLNSARATIDQMQKDFDRRSDALRTESPTMSDTDRQKKARELEDLRTTIGRKRTDLSEELDKLSAEALREISKKANAAIEKIAKDEKYDVVLQQAIIVADRIDMTDRVLEEMNRNQ